MVSKAGLEKALRRVQGETVEVQSVWYRAVDPDGKVWTEAKSLEQVLEESKGRNCRFLKQVTTLHISNWEQMSKKELKS